MVGEHLIGPPVDGRGQAGDRGLQLALDHDLILSAVERPWPRAVLNALAYTDLIPVIDGGIAIDVLPTGAMLNATWRSHVLRPGRPCMSCTLQLDGAAVASDIQGLLDDPEYIAQVDPVLGGSASAYDYCYGDPVNCTDLDGRHARRGRWRRGHCHRGCRGPRGGGTHYWTTWTASGCAVVCWAATRQQGRWSFQLGGSIGASAGISRGRSSRRWNRRSCKYMGTSASIGRIGGYANWGRNRAGSGRRQWSGDNERGDTFGAGMTPLYAYKVLGGNCV